jgi:hypothetical protein
MHRSFARILTALLVIAAEFGCAGPKQDPLKSTLSAWIGRSIADFVDQRGQPTNTVDMGQGRARFQWVTGDVKTSAMSPAGGNVVLIPPSSSSCLISLVATSASSNPNLSDWTIESWSLNGNC